MRMDLRFWLYLVDRQLKGRYRLVKIALPFRALKRQSFPQSRFIYLNDANSMFFKGKDFFAQSESNLINRLPFRKYKPLETTNCKS